MPAHAQGFNITYKTYKIVWVTTNLEESKVSFFNSFADVHCSQMFTFETISKKY